MTAPDMPGSGAPYGAPQGYGAPPPGYGAPAQQGTNGLAIGALVCAFLVPPVGLILGIVAKGQIKRTGQGGNGLATAAIVISALSMLLVAVAVIAALAGGGAATTG